MLSILAPPKTHHSPALGFPRFQIWAGRWNGDALCSGNLKDRHRPVGARLTMVPFCLHLHFLLLLVFSNLHLKSSVSTTYTMLWLGLLSIPAAVQAQGFSTTMLRFGCSQIVIDRIDPYV